MSMVLSRGEGTTCAAAMGRGGVAAAAEEKPPVDEAAAVFWRESDEVSDLSDLTDLAEFAGFAGLTGDPDLDRYYGGEGRGGSVGSRWERPDDYDDDNDDDYDARSDLAGYDDAVFSEGRASSTIGIV